MLKSTETSHTSILYVGKTKQGCPGVARAGAGSEPRLCGWSTSPLLAPRRARGSAPPPPPRPAPPGAAHLLPAPGASAPRGICRRTEPRPQPPASRSRYKVCSASRPLAPRSREGSCCPGPSHGRRPQAAPGSAAAPAGLGRLRALRAGNPRPTGPGAAPAVYRGRGPLSPPAACAPLTSFILALPRPPPRCQTVTHHGRGRRGPLRERWLEAPSRAGQTGATS